MEILDKVVNEMVKALMRRYKQFCAVTALSTYLTLFYTFIYAYMSESKSVVVTINEYGEANLEFLMLMVALPGIVTWLSKMILGVEQ